MAERLLASFVPLLDCAVLVVAREKGFAAAEGIDLKLVREPSWASLRDHLCLGYVDCAHALAPLPVALQLGATYLPVDCCVPFVLSRGGNAITVSSEVFRALEEIAGGLRFDDGPEAAGAALAALSRRRVEPLTLGVAFPFSNHNFDLRYWLAASGLHPDRDVRLVAIPPPLMVDALLAGLVDGFCVGEPWNSLAVEQRVGHVVVTQSQLFSRAVEKVLVVRSAFIENRERLNRLLRAFDAAARWADDPDNRGVLAKLLALPRYVGAPAELIESVLAGRIPLGGQHYAHDPDFMFFHRYAANVPSAADGLWAYAQMVRWGQIRASAHDEALSAGVYRPDLYLNGGGQSLREPSRRVQPFDAVEFTTGNVIGYLEQFALCTPFEARAID